jgi:hypothetical protein
VIKRIYLEIIYVRMSISNFTTPFSETEGSKGQVKHLATVLSVYICYILETAILFSHKTVIDTHYGGQ